jgi:hypothetical protein
VKRTTCLAYLGSLVLLSRATLGCAEDAEYLVPDEPTGPALADVTPLPPRRTIVAPSRDEVISRWELPSSSPWLPYEKFTLPSVLAETPQALPMPNLDDLDEVRWARLAAARVAEEGLPNDAAWFIDLPGAASVAFAWSLARYSPTAIAAVPTFNNWPAEDELVPAEQTLTAMITMPPRVPTDADVGARPVFLLDSWRLAYKEELIDEGVIDNRYMLSRADFPSAEVLRAQGISQIIYVVGSEDVLDEEDDLNDLFADYEDAGIALHLVDLESIMRIREAGEPSWYVQAQARYFHIRRRMTAVHDPRFYARSRGGFGGLHLMPVPAGYVHGGGSFHGGG